MTHVFRGVSQLLLSMIVVNIVFIVAKLGNICFGHKICVREAKMLFLTPGKNIFCFQAAKFVSATYVSRVAKLGNICLRNNVSATMFPSLVRPQVYAFRSSF